MSVVFVLVPLAMVMAGVAVAAFLWSVRNGQLDDLDTPQHRMLFDDDARVKSQREGAK
jgi:cbb3-type cytochrome oxidase maturation protein